MAVSKIRVSQLPKVGDINNFEVLGLDTSNNQNAKADMTQLKGNTGDSAFQMWLKQPGNADKTYDDYLAYNRQPATDAAASVSALESRIKQSEQERVAAEQSRVATEETRETAEQSRKITEQGRVTKEEERILAEQGRATTEQERITSENQRKSAEEARNTAEQNRASTEKERETAESTRETQEQARQTNTATAIQNTDKAADRLNHLSDHRDEIRDSYWWRWNENTGEYENTGEKARGDVMYATFEINDDGILIMTTPNGYDGPDFELVGSDLYININE